MEGIKERTYLLRKVFTMRSQRCCNVLEALVKKEKRFQLSDVWALRQYIYPRMIYVHANRIEEKPESKVSYVQQQQFLE